MKQNPESPDVNREKKPEKKSEENYTNPKPVSKFTERKNNLEQKSQPKKISPFSGLADIIKK